MDLDVLKEQNEEDGNEEDEEEDDDDDEANYNVDDDGEEVNDDEEANNDDDDDKSRVEDAQERRRSTKKDTKVNQEKRLKKPTSSRRYDDERCKEKHDFAAFSLSFRDMEGSLRQFNGKDGYPINKWIEDFEELSELTGWNDLQKLIFAKKSLDGLAKILVCAERGVTSWYKLKCLLRKEFEESVSSAEIHRTLMMRSKRREESVQEYVLVMREIASRANITTDVVIQYIIDGIPDDPANKLMLYGTKTFEELKEKVKIYDLIKKRNQGDTKFERKKCSSNEKQKNTHEDSKEEKKPVRCFTCGARGHVSRDCPDKSKGFKCFNCNRFGHKSAECPSKNDDRPKNIRLVDRENKNPAYKKITIRGKEILALFDTGSDVNLIRYEDFLTLGSISLDKADTIVLTGIGNNKLKTNGSIYVDIAVDDVTLKTKIHVVNNEVVNVPVILGHEFLVKTITKIDINGINVTQKGEDDEEEEELHILRIEYEEQEIELGHIQNNETRNKIQKLYQNYNPDNKTKETMLRMKIILKDEKPIYQRPRRLAHSEKIEVEKQMKEWLHEGIIRPSRSEFTSPIVLVRKKNGTTRICQDYRKLNLQIVKDRYPLPLIEDQLDRLQGSTVFSTLDLKNGFFHVPIDEESKKYTSFITPNAQYEFNKTPFGLCNSPSMFQRFINDIFEEHIKNGILLTYMDDLVILARDNEEGVERLREVLKTAEEYGLQIQWKKCQFLKNNIEYLGHHIENGQIKPSSTKIDAVTKFPKPTTVKQIQSFLGLTGYFRKFVKNYSLIAKPLSDLLRKNVAFNFREKEYEAFKMLKMILSTRPVLGIYNVEAETELHTDACINGYGAVLLQKNDSGEFHPIHYMSRKTTDAERKYSSYELEVLAIVYALKKYRVYLLGVPFKIVTDCSALTQTIKKQDLSTRVARWIMTLSEFNYTVEHRSANRMKHADALSRNILMVAMNNDFIKTIEAVQLDDEHLRVIYKLLKNGQPHKNYILKNNLLHRRYEGRDLLVVPRQMEIGIIKKYHEENGHFSTRKTKELILRELWISDVQTKIETCVKNCIACILTERKSGKAEGYLNPISKDEAPLSTYHIDHLGPMTATNKGYKYLLVVVDGFTKFVWLYPSKTLTSQEVIDKLENQKNIFGNPKRIIADRGTAFTSNIFQDYCNNENIDLVHITTGVARSNGQVERINRIIIPVLTKLTIEDETKWFKYVSDIQRSINGTFQRSINTSPYELLFGVQSRQASDLNLQEIIEAEYRKTFIDNREELRKSAKEQILKVQEENCKTYNRKRKQAINYRCGDLIAIKRTQFVNLGKLKCKFLGPYRITAIKGHDRYEVQRVGPGDGPKMTSTAVDFMKPWLPSTKADLGDEDTSDYDFGPEDVTTDRNGRVIGSSPHDTPLLAEEEAGSEKKDGDMTSNTKRRR